MDNGNPWEIFNGVTATAPEMPTQHPEAQRVKTIVTRVLGWILLGAFLLYVLFSLLVHPIDRLKLNIFFSGGNYTIDLAGTIRYSDGIRNYVVNNYPLGKIQVDRNLVCVTDRSGDEIYYLLEGETVYVYTQDADGNWNRKESAKSLPVVGTSFGDAIMDRKSYERGELFRYHTKEGIDTGSYDEIYIQQWGLKYEMEARNADGSVVATMTFGSFGTTKITPPWEQ